MYYISECYFYISTATLFLTLVTIVLCNYDFASYIVTLSNFKLSHHYFIYSEADDVFIGNIKKLKQITNWIFTLHIYIYIYICICVCVEFPVFVEETVEIFCSVCKRRQVCKLRQQLRRKLHLHGWESMEALGSHAQQQNEDVTCDKLATVVSARPITYTVSVFVYIHPCAFEHGNAWNLRSTATLRHSR